MLPPLLLVLRPVLLLTGSLTGDDNRTINSRNVEQEQRSQSSSSSPLIKWAQPMPLDFGPGKLAELEVGAGKSWQLAALTFEGNHLTDDRAHAST